VTLRVVVIDDEDLPRQRVRDFVNAHAALTLVGEATDGAQALDLVGEQRPDLIFLDIQLPERDGFQVVAAFDDDVLPAIVFVTAYDQYAIRAFEVDAVDYLLKPITQKRFDAAVARVLGRVEHRATVAQIRALAERMNERHGYATRFVARRGGRHYFVRVADIDWLESSGNYIRLHAGETSHLIRAPMKGVETRLDPAHFVRIHRSTMVAIDRIHAIESGEHGEYVITLAGGRRLVSSRTFSERVRRLLR
jgi:two-component system, LytTR family, response regulator